MSSRSLSRIGLRQTELRAVESRMKELGQTTNEYLKSLVQRDLKMRIFDDILAKARKDARESGLTPTKLDALVRRARKRRRVVRLEKRSK